MAGGKKNAPSQRPRRAIRGEAELGLVTGEVHSLLRREDQLSNKDKEHLEYLTNLIEEYEEEHFPIPEPTQAELLRHLLDARDESARQVAAATGVPYGTLLAILASKQDVGAHAAALASYFHVQSEVFHRRGAEAEGEFRAPIEASLGPEGQYLVPMQAPGLARTMQLEEGGFLVQPDPVQPAPARQLAV